MSQPSLNERRHPNDAPTDHAPIDDEPNLVDVRIPPPGRVPVFEGLYLPERDPFAPPRSTSGP